MSQLAIKDSTKKINIMEKINSDAMLLIIIIIVIMVFMIVARYI